MFRHKFYVQYYMWEDTFLFCEIINKICSVGAVLLRSVGLSEAKIFFLHGLMQLLKMTFVYLPTT